MPQKRNKPNQDITAKNDPADIPYKILVVDDDPNMREVIMELLSEEGYQPFAVSSGKEAIEECQRDDFNVGIIDIKLPDMDGTDLIQFLKKISPAMITIAVTGYPTIENAVQSLNYGAEGYIIKPFNPTKLLDQIHEQLNKHKIETWTNLLMTTGLSSNEAKIYLTLAEKGAIEPSKISLISGVPRTKTYSVLKKLIQSGIITEVPGAKQLFTTSTPSKAFNGFLKKMKQELSQQEKTLSELEHAIITLDQMHLNEQKNLKINMQKQELWFFHDQTQIWNKMSELMSTSKKSIQIIANQETFEVFIQTFGKMLQALALKNVKVKIFTPTCKQNNLSKQLQNFFSIKNFDLTTPLLFLIIDDNSFFLVDTKDKSTERAFGQSALFAEGEPALSFCKNLIGIRK